ncbi:hypothetical protein C8Q73DRAFT_687866 [Cubamyces lactineus]|nr:hypothetical protein C8Q73DRAFT_687866 [Cubamyces lactineus]
MGVLAILCPCASNCAVAHAASLACVAFDLLRLRSSKAGIRTSIPRSTSLFSTPGIACRTPAPGPPIRASMIDTYRFQCT